MINYRFLTCLGVCLLFLNVSTSIRAQQTTPDASFLDVPVEWQTHANQPVQLKQWLGKRVVLSMFYTSCSSACPIILQKMKLIEKKLEAQGMKAEFIVISFDAATDDPAKLNHFRRHMEVDRDNWTFLVSSAENTRLMANLLGFRYRKNQDTGEIFHNNRILLIDESGQNIKVLEGLDAALDDLL